MAFSVIVGVSEGGCWISSIGKPSNSSSSQYSKLVGFGDSEGIGSGFGFGSGWVGSGSESGSGSERVRGGEWRKVVVVVVV